MGRYFFDIKDGHRLVDPRGVECEDDAQAVEWARLVAAKIGYEKERRFIAVIDPSGHEVAKVPINSDPG